MNYHPWQVPRDPLVCSHVGRVQCRKGRGAKTYTLRTQGSGATVDMVFYSLDKERPILVQVKQPSTSRCAWG